MTDLNLRIDERVSLEAGIRAMLDTHRRCVIQECIRQIRSDGKERGVTNAELAEWEAALLMLIEGKRAP